MHLVLFDIDGTLIHIKKGISQSIFASVLNDTLGIQMDSRIHIDFAGRTDFGIITSIFKTLNLDQQLFLDNKDIIYQKINEEFKSQLVQSDIQVLDGVVELLDILHRDDRFKIGLVTGNFELNAHTKLEIAKLIDYFDFGAYGDNFPNRLDLPKTALNNAKALYPDVSSKKTIVVGDTHRDIQSAQHNKMKSMAVATGNTPYYELLKFEPDLIFSSLEEYLDVYKSILNIFDING